MDRINPKWDFIAQADEARDCCNWALAASKYEAALGFDPTLSAIWVQLGHARKENGDPEGGADAYIAALRLDNRYDDAWVALTGLKWPRAIILNAIGGKNIPQEPIQPVLRIYDLTDLILYIANSRVLTGIQRVQVQLVQALLEMDSLGAAAAYDTGVRGWLYIPLSMFYRLVALSSADTNADADDWKNFLSELSNWRYSGAEINFSSNSSLINLGSSWAAEGYMESLLAIQKSHKIRYYPFVHDLIPIRYPESCAPGLPASFSRWLRAANSQAQKFLVSSDAVGKDLVEFGGARLDQVLPPLRLNGPFIDTSSKNVATFPFVLIVSTLEQRKNHNIAFTVWERLVRERGLTGTPDLMCVGRNGPGAEYIRDDLKSRPTLKGVVNLTGPLSDADLAASYLSCLFVLCPSFYEGWGLPVSEALSFGKAVIASRVGGQPEAGGRLVVYFDPQSPENLYQRIKSYLDCPWKLRLAGIRNQLLYRPRSWGRIAQDLLQHIAT